MGQNFDRKTWKILDKELSCGLLSFDRKRENSGHALNSFSLQSINTFFPFLPTKISGWVKFAELISKHYIDLIDKVFVTVDHLWHKDK